MDTLDVLVLMLAVVDAVVYIWTLQERLNTHTLSPCTLAREAVQLRVNVTMKQHK